MVPDGVYDVRTLSIPIFAGRPLLSAGSVLKYGLGMKSWYRLLQSRLLTEPTPPRSEEHTSELQSLIRTSYAVFCLIKKISKKHTWKSIQHSTHIETDNYAHIPSLNL